MFVTVKKKTIGIILFVLLITVSIGLLISPILSVGSAGNGKTVVIDAGHGGIDGGVVGIKTGTKESDINLSIARKLKTHLTQAGYNVVMTRVNSDGLYGMASKNKKLKDMERRKEKIEEAKPDLVVSIHCNQYPRASVRGAQVFYAPDSEAGKTSAAVVQSLLNTNLEASKRVEAPGDYYILQCSQYLSLLVECGFLSSPDDEKLLIDADYQDKVAYTVFSGIHAVLNAGQGAAT